MTAEQRKRREEVRIRAADLFEENVKVPCAARELWVSEKSVYQWRRAWVSGGREALRSQGPTGYDCRLDPDLRVQLSTWPEEGPAAHRWADEQVWTAARVRTLIGRTFHLSYGASEVTRLPHRMGSRVQMPARPAAERDEDAVTAWQEAAWQEVKPSGRRPARCGTVLTALLMPGFCGPPLRDGPARKPWPAQKS
ncbi:transposase [Streptomyces sp. NPDC050287]|uniref:transposase n=1 Tax=Streptomyces sp. NPDC050287 TaxID=3365608 RepID=UPI00379C4B38